MGQEIIWVDNSREEERANIEDDKGKKKHTQNTREKESTKKKKKRRKREFSIELEFFCS